MHCKDYNDENYMYNAANDLIEVLNSKGLKISSTVLANLVKQLNIVFRNIDDKSKIAQMNQKLEHMMQVVEDALHQISNEKHYAITPQRREEAEKEIIVLNAILHDTGRIFEIALLGTSGSQINFSHASLGGSFLENSTETALLDNTGKDLHVTEIDEFLISNIEKQFGEKATPEQLKKLSRLNLMCLPYSLNKLKVSGDLSATQIILYCIKHHGDKNIPEECPEGIKPFLESIRVSDRIANLKQGSEIDPALITGGKSAYEIATIAQLADIKENRTNAPVIDDLTYHELTIGATREDGSTYFGIDRFRKTDEVGREIVYTPMRMFLSRVGWVYADDNNLPFYTYCKESKTFERYIESIKPYLSKEDTSRISEIETKVAKYLDLQISKGKSKSTHSDPSSDEFQI